MTEDLFASEKRIQAEKVYQSILTPCVRGESDTRKAGRAKGNLSDLRCGG